MTKATQNTFENTFQNNLNILPTMTYQVAMPKPTNHLFEVTLEVENWQLPILDLKMPVWTPGSYLVREYSGKVQNFSAQTSDQKYALVSYKKSKNHWQIETEDHDKITISYQVFASELTVRTNHLDITHGYFNGTALFFFIPGLEQQPIEVKIIPPNPNWIVTTSLPKIAENTFKASDFDTLVDNPFEIGTQEIYDFQVLGKPHQWVIWGKGNLNAKKLIRDTTKIIETEAKIFGGLPYENYLFLLHLSASGFGGLEHKNCCSLNYPRFAFGSKDGYNRFLQLVAHEFFHLWNVKRIRPKELETFDYEEENYTQSLWFCEGTTSYYDILIPFKARIYNSTTFLSNLSKDITKYLSTPGRKVQPLSESSFDAWVKLYRRDQNSDNSQISYYLKGELVTLLLDLLIRAKHQNKRSFDNIMLLMWEKFGQDEIGFTSTQLKEIIESVAEVDLTDFYRRYIHGIEELPFDEYLQPFGLQLKSMIENESLPYLGIKTQWENGKEIIKFVEANSPAEEAGIEAKDELLAIDGIRVTAEKLNSRLQDYQSEDIIQITLFHQEELKTYDVKLASPQPSRYEIIEIEKASQSQKRLRGGWLK